MTILGLNFQYLRDKATSIAVGGLAVVTSYAISQVSQCLTPQEKCTTTRGWFQDYKTCATIENDCTNLIALSTVLGTLTIALLSRKYIRSFINKICDVFAISVGNPWENGLIELESLTGRVIDLKRPFDLSDLIASSIHPFIPDQMKEFTLVTNCKDLQEAQVIFLGEHHRDPACLKLQEKMLKEIARSDDVVFIEEDKTDFSKSAAEFGLWTFPEHLKYKGWDALDHSELTTYSRSTRMLLRELCVDLRKSLDHLKRDELLDQSFMEKIRKFCSLSKLSKSFLLEKDEEVLLENKWKAKIEEAKKNNNCFMELECYAKQALEASEILYSRINNWEKRQKSLVSCFQNPFLANKQFYIAGRNHFFRRSKIEAILANGIEQNRIKYVMVIPPNIEDKDLVTNIDTDQEAILEVYELFALFNLRLQELEKYNKPN